MEKIPRSRLSDVVVDRIKAMIQSGEYPPGKRLPSEKDLAEAFGVSRMCIREALSVLAAARIIEVRHGEGSFVRQVDVSTYIPPVAASLLNFPEAALHLLEVRILLEAGAAELAAARADEETVRQMEEALAAYWDEVSAHGTGANSDLRLHRAIARATQNPVLVELMDRISDLVAEGMAYTLGKNQGDAERVRQVADEHAAIVAAIRQHDAAAARTAMVDHLENVRGKLVRLVTRTVPRAQEVQAGAPPASPQGQEPPVQAPRARTKGTYSGEDEA
ncbi:FadR/GntR family transcriptional regulator [Alicyclobacillus macrosporangiidus]|uniref:GntR family transcriptional regulator, transcriptional repressor for pyruvate dehydrogenase complex n=1 Tax=Alicyclobacillus macrosporangiidus TaxID=392015 RepID=A0A1I7GIP1_9BACL|nr:FadR/GntR family transcriptional regulator [Alicyclobacillus macrosporangiidus]SFU48289.1 GntR family transcriptional regulator, transcriptional repressor for pyruvate dehydrogenase complex [Alicyclobacillus macrosporangiidus]